MGYDALTGLVDRLAEVAGLRPTQEDVGGPMGSARWRFSDGIVDLDLNCDKGTWGVTVGPTGFATFQISVWETVLGRQGPTDASFDEQLNFFLENLDDIREFISHGSEAGARLRNENWTQVRDKLGLDPEAEWPVSRDIGYS